MDKPSLEKAIADKVSTINGRSTLTCEDALGIASKLSVDPKAVRKYCDERKIKIVECKLGCFS